MTRTKSLFTIGLATTLLLVGCTTATPYQPLTPGSKVSGGYSEQRLEDNRFRREPVAQRIDETLA